MTPYRRIAAFFNIESGEEKIIGSLLLFYFVLELAFILILSVAFGVFIDEYGPEGLPYSYMVIAIFASLATVFYIRLGEQVSFSRVLMTTLAILGTFSFSVWLGLRSPFYHYVSFLLPLLFQTVVNLGNLVVWQLAGRLFNFQQAKRLFPLLTSGAWLADVLAGLLVVSLVGWLGSTNLILVAAALIGFAMPILRRITNTHLAPETQMKTSPGRHIKKPTGYLKNRYVLLIFSYVILWWVAFFFMDNIFSNRAATQFPDANQLTAFMGQLLSITGIVALISSTLLTGRIIRRFGLRAGLVGMPLLVTLAVGGLAISGTLGGTMVLVFGLSALAKLINDAFGFTLSQSANAIVYQSVPDNIRERVQATAEGIIKPLAIGLAGITLLALTAGLKFDYLGLSYVFLGLSVIWLLAIFLLSGGYVRALTQVITKRRLGDDVNVLADPASIALLQNRLHDSHAGVAIYALNKLEAIDVPTVIKELPNLIRHPAPEVRREAFVRVENLNLRSVVNAVQNQLSVETIPAVKESALRALGAIADDPSQLTHALDETDIHSQRGALIGLLKHGNESTAEQKLNALLSSNASEDRILAIQVMGEVNRREFYPQLIGACDRSPETGRAAGLAFVTIGAESLPEIESAWGESDASRQRLLTLSRVLGRIGGAHSQTILLSRISTPDHELRSQILNALSQSGYRTKDKSAIERAVKVEVERAAWVSAARVDLGETDETALLIAALQEYQVQIRNRALLLLSFAFDGNSIRRVREALQVGSSTQVSYALEIIDTQLPAEWKPWVMPLLEDLSPQARSRRFAAFFPQTRQTCEERLGALIANEDFSDWVRACAMYAAQKGDIAMLSTVEKVLILKTVSMFSQTPDNVLADVADLLEEVDVSENETIFKQGDPGDSLYMILDGKVRVHDGERLLNYLGERDVFGEMALLDPAPRLASVTAVERTRLFRLEQTPFFELMSERPEVARGIIHILTEHLRNRVRDIAQLNSRIKELENGGPA